MRFLLALTLALFPLLANAAGFTPAQRAEIEAIVQQTVAKNPEMVGDALDNLQKKLADAEEAKQSKAVTENKTALADPGKSPIDGNPKGDVTIVEFFDYNCGYCRAMEPLRKQLMEEDAGVRFIMKDYPILSDESVIAAKAALAARDQGKYIAFHNVLMTSQEKPNADNIAKFAVQAGVDPEAQKKAMTSPALTAEIKQTYELADKLGIRGTPAFVIGDKLYAGAMSYEQLKTAVAEARKAKP